MPLLAARPVTVLPEQREVLEQLVRTRSTPQQLAMRARLILHAADAMGVYASARELGVWPKTARYWRKRWREAADRQSVPERLADARFDEIEHAAVGDRDAGNLDADIGDGLAEKILRLRSCHGQQQGGGDDEHQNACLFLTSRA